MPSGVLLPQKIFEIFKSPQALLLLHSMLHLHELCQQTHLPCCYPDPRINRLHSPRCKNPVPRHTAILALDFPSICCLPSPSRCFHQTCVFFIQTSAAPACLVLSTSMQLHIIHLIATFNCHWTCTRSKSANPSTLSFSSAAFPLLPLLFKPFHQAKFQLLQYPCKHNCESCTLKIILCLVY